MPQNSPTSPQGRLTFRQTEILRVAREKGSAGIAELARLLGVSLETVRRDIRPLADSGELAKVHGAVKMPFATGEAPFERRLRENAAEKRLIVRHAADLVNDGDSVMLDTGTTTSMLARELLRKRSLTVVTNSSDIARILATVNGNTVYMAGGELHGDNGAAFGASAVEFIERFKVRHAFISIAAIDPQMGLMDFHLAEAEFARTVLKRGKRRMVVSDHTKFDRTALVKVCDFADIDLLITDRLPSNEITEALARSGTELSVVPAILS
jgi:DeoR family glycerol-3-phosphate regulon repressor